MGSFLKSAGNAVIIALGSMSFGAVTAYYSPAKDSLIGELDLTKNLGDIFNTFAMAFAALGSLISKPLVNKFGRKHSVFITDIFAAVFTVLLIVSNASYAWLAFIARAMNGICTGIFGGLCSMYLIEISPLKYRGIFGVFAQMLVSIGNTYSFFVGNFVKWRYLACALLGINVVQAVLIWVVPDSDVHELEHESESVFQKKFVLPGVHSVVFVLAQQFSGINYVLTNLNDIYGGANFSISTNVASILTSLGGTVGCIISTFVIEKFGRRPTWIISAFIQTGALVLFWLQALLKGPAILQVIALIVYIIGFGIGFGPIPWMIVPELFPDSVRSFFQSILTTLNWLAASLTTYVVPKIADSIGFGWTIFIFAIVCCLAGIYGLLLMPETKGKEAGHDYLNDPDGEFNLTTATDDRSILQSQINPLPL